MKIRNSKYLIITSLFFFIIIGQVKAQSFRSLINKGVEEYQKKKYSNAEVNFKKGLEKDFNSFVGHFNLGDAFYKEGRYNQALREYKNALSFAKTKEEKANVFHNIGNALLKSNKIKESIGAYANALKLKPDDLSTKYNLSYALKLLKKQKKNQKNKNNKNNKNKNQKKKQNQKQNQKQKQNKNKQYKTKRQKQKNQQKPKISKKEAERILAALKNKEKELQKKLRKRKAKRVVKNGKDW